MVWTFDEIAARAARKISSENLVSLGIGLPTKVANHVDRTGPVMIHSANGVLGLMSPNQNGTPIDRVANAEGMPSAIRSGGSVFDINSSVTMMRGGHIDVAILEATEVDQGGNLAISQTKDLQNFGIGSSMDLLVGARRVLVCMPHTNDDGTPKLVAKCGLPLDAHQAVNMVITTMGVFEIHDEHFHLIELAPEVTWQEVCANTAGAVVDDLQTLIRSGMPDNTK